MENIFKSLRTDHDFQRKLVGQLVDTTGGSDEREAVFNILKRELSAHAAAEERFFYRPLMAHDLTLEKARHSVSEHKELDDLIDKLNDDEQSSPGWLVNAKKLEERLIHHLDEEEREVFQIAGKALDEAQKAQLATGYQSEKEKRDLGK